MYKRQANNLQALQAYSAQTSSPCYFLLSPTAAAIAQQKIPSLALESLFNQKLYIQRCYSSLSSFRTIDAYNGLFSHQSEYLFYRTDSRLTALGCYYLYVSAGEKLGYTARSMDYFSISHPMHDYRGNLTQQVPYAQVEPDVISLFHYQKDVYKRQAPAPPGYGPCRIPRWNFSPAAASPSECPVPGRSARPSKDPLYYTAWCGRRWYNP